MNYFFLPSPSQVQFVGTRVWPIVPTPFELIRMLTQFKIIELVFLPSSSQVQIVGARVWPIVPTTFELRMVIQFTIIDLVFFP